MTKTKLLFFDCESTGLPLRRDLSPWDVEGWPRLVQLAWGTYDPLGNLLDIRSSIIRPDGFTIPAEATTIHGISHSRAVAEGEELARVLDDFGEAIESPSITLVAHNIDFDCGVVGAEFIRLKKSFRLLDVPAVCTMKTTAEVCRLPRPYGPGFKWPTLDELHLHLFGGSYERPHDAANDLQACARCFFRLLQDGHYRLP
jgi:DNA polymerase III epsilon subunit-like protein